MRWELNPLTDADLRFLVETAGLEGCDLAALKQVLRTDPDFREAFIGSEETWRAVSEDRNVFLRISPRLYFEVLLRRVHRDLDRITHTLERVGGDRVAVFDAAEVRGLMDRREVLLYLAQLMASFTRVESASFSWRVGRGTWMRFRFSGMDVEAMIRLAERVGEERRAGIYRRIADLCLFILGVFPEYARSAPARASLAGGWGSLGPEDLYEEGRRYYELAAEEAAPAGTPVSDLLMSLSDHFHLAVKPLALVADRHLKMEKAALLGEQS